jgi:branched-chain amino acid transport system substrate-binding protein
MRLMSICLLVLACLAQAFALNDANAEAPDSPVSLVFGQTAAFEGPAAALGRGMRLGIEAAFEEVNSRGGVHGRKLELVAYDDGYEPDRAIENAKRLIHEDHVFALIGGVGTPTANGIVPVITQEQVPFIGPFTGAGLLRNPFNRYVVNVRASYAQELEALVEHLTKDMGARRIAVFYQDDTYGRDGLAGVTRALDKRGMTIAGQASYQRNTIAVKSAIIELRQAKPDVVIMIGAYKPCAELIRISHQIGFKPQFAGISFIGSHALASELGQEGRGLIISQVVPLPSDPGSSFLVRRYGAAMDAFLPGNVKEFISLEGYLTGRFVIEVLGHLDGELTPERFIEEVYAASAVKVDDVTLHFDPDDNQGMDQVFLTILDRDDVFRPLGSTNSNKQEAARD